MTQIIQSLTDISDRYDVLLCDLWGCVHDGVKVYPEAIPALRAFRAAGKIVVLLTNSPRDRHAVAEQVARFGLPDDCWDTIASSGDAARAALFTGAVQRVREVKSAAEVEAIRTSCAIAGRAFARVPEIAGPGRPLDRVFRDFQAMLLQEGADWVSYLAGGAGPDGYGDVISPASSDPLQGGDVLMLDTGAVRNGYFCDFDRNYTVGPASDAVKRTHAALWEATEDTLAALRPGMLARDAHRLLSEALVRRGAEPGGGRLGHGLGITLTEWPSFTPLDHTPLREGMVLTLEPGALVAPGRMLVHEETIVLRAHGPELLSPRAPLDMPELS